MTVYLIQSVALAFTMILNLYDFLVDLKLKECADPRWSQAFMARHVLGPYQWSGGHQRFEFLRIQFEIQTLGQNQNAK